MTNTTDVDPPPDVVPGLYHHFRGGFYEVLGVARHEANGRLYVVYRSAGDRHPRMWIRPINRFVEVLEVRGQKVPRFRLVEERTEP